VTEVYDSAGKLVGPLNLVDEVYVTAQSPDILRDTINDPTVFVTGANNISMPASVFQPSLYADVYLDGVSLPASTPFCKTERKLVANPGPYGRYGTDYAFKL